MRTATGLDQPEQFLAFLPGDPGHSARPPTLPLGQASGWGGAMAGRRWFTLLGGLAVPMSGLVPAWAAPVKTAHAMAAKTTRLTLIVSADEVDYATRVTVSGKLTAGGTGIKHQKLVLKHRAGGSKTWTKV